MEYKIEMGGSETLEEDDSPIPQNFKITAKPVLDEYSKTLKVPLCRVIDVLTSFTSIELFTEDNEPIKLPNEQLHVSANGSSLFQIEFGKVYNIPVSFAFFTELAVQLRTALPIAKAVISFKGKIFTVKYRDQLFKRLVSKPITFANGRYRVHSSGLVREVWPSEYNQKHDKEPKYQLEF